MQHRFILFFILTFALSASLFSESHAEATETLSSGLSWDFGGTRFTSEVIVKDRLTGLALGGVDPLSYFISDKPFHGKPRFDLSFRGALWWFANAGNRAAFQDAPDIYMPQFGGFGAMAAARGHLAEGRAQIWRVQNDQLLLFHSYANRIAWEQNPDELFEKAKKRWPKLVEKLVP
ncbi:MAG: YHS domain-containing (seleno)protein [Hyphomicrobiales bacterium]